MVLFETPGCTGLVSKMHQACLDVLPAAQVFFWRLLHEGQIWAGEAELLNFEPKGQTLSDLPGSAVSHSKLRKWVPTIVSFKNHYCIRDLNSLRSDSWVRVISGFGLVCCRGHCLEHWVFHIHLMPFGTQFLLHFTLNRLKRSWWNCSLVLFN